MLTAIPLIFATVVFLGLLRKFNKGPRESFLLTLVVCGLSVAVLTELLSLVNLVSTAGLATGWSLLAIAAVAYYRFLPTRTQTIPKPAEHLTLSGHVFVFFLGLMVIVIAIKAYIVPICAGDSMVYHSSRIMHWLQNANVDFFPTNCLQELHLSPWAEYAALHLQLLFGSDRLSNFVQFFSMLGSLVVVSLLARELGAKLRGQLAAVIVCATLPMGIMQASGSQIDYAAAFWYAAFAYFVLKYSSVRSLQFLLFCSVTLGLAIFTKGTNYVFAFPFFIWLVTIISRQAKSFKNIAILIAVVTLINSGLFIRNTILFHNPLGPMQENTNSSEKYVNEEISLRVFASNVVRNAALHFNTVSTRINKARDSAVLSFHRIMGISAEDPRSSAWMYGQKFKIHQVRYWEFSDGNTMHFLLFLACACLVFFSANTTRKGKMLLLGCLAGAFLFCLVLKWQFFHSRLHLPLFVLMSALAGVVVGRFHSYIGVAICSLLLVMSLPNVFSERNKPLFGANSIFNQKREDMYFLQGSHYQSGVTEAVNRIRRSKTKEVGIIVEHVAWEYPIFALLGKGYHLEHVAVNNRSTFTANSRRLAHFDPGYIVRLKASNSPGIAGVPVYQAIDQIVYHSRVYIMGFQDNAVELFEKRP
jgi:hypothetical protein